jgi:hypothetical protein
MVKLLEEPAILPQNKATKGDWISRPWLTRFRDKEAVIPESLFHMAEYSRKTALRILELDALFSFEFVPTSLYEKMLIADMALAKARVDRAAELQVAMGDRGVNRTATYWLEDQKTRALTLRARLSKDPMRVVHALEGFKQGAELVVGLWQGLSDVLISTGDWDQEQRSLALDLLAVPRELRTENSAPLPPAGDKAGLTDLTTREIARWTERIDGILDDRDQQCREDTLAGLSLDEDARLKRLKRTETNERRNYNKAVAELKRVRREAEAANGGTRNTLRPGDEDPLIKRIKMIAYPPPVAVEIEAMLGAVPRIVQPPVANAPEPVVGCESPTVANDVTPATPSAPESTVVRDVATPSETASEIESALLAFADQASATDDPEATLPMSRLTRRARKLHQRRMHAAHLEARKKGE